MIEKFHNAAHYKNLTRHLFIGAFLTLIVSCATTQTEVAVPTAPEEAIKKADVAGEADAPRKPKFGVMVMAHGGGDTWNQALLDLTDPLKSEYPLEVAFGMADAGSMEDAVRRLEAQGVTKVGVVRVFISGESWFDRTLQILGMQEGAPEHGEVDHDHGEDHFMPMGFWRIDTPIEFVVSKDGLADAAEMNQVVTDRLSALSKDPSSEVAVLIAHGPADDDENERWIAKIKQRALGAQETLGLRDIQVFTLREDWPEARKKAEQKIKNYIRGASKKGMTALVFPYRVQGFGPYAKVLEALDYRAKEEGLLPHPNVGLWLSQQIELLKHQSN